MSGEQGLLLLAELIELERHLRAAGHWQSSPIDPLALESVEPFCIDTMTFVQWLQFMFIPRLRAMIDARVALPASSAIAALAEEYFKSNISQGLPCIECLRRIDCLLTDVC